AFCFLLSAFCLAALLSGCGAETPPSSPVASSTPGQTTVEIYATGGWAGEHLFVPNEVTVQIGTTVLWTNKQIAPHTITANDGSFASGNLGKGDTFSHKFDKAGKVDYYCALHGGMAGHIIVTA